MYNVGRFYTFLIQGGIALGSFCLSSKTVLPHIIMWHPWAFAHDDNHVCIFVDTYMYVRIRYLTDTKTPNFACIQYSNDLLAFPILQEVEVWTTVKNNTNKSTNKAVPWSCWRTGPMLNLYIHFCVDTISESHVVTLTCLNKTAIITV